MNEERKYTVKEVIFMTMQQLGEILLPNSMEAAADQIRVARRNLRECVQAIEMEEKSQADKAAAEARAAAEADKTEKTLRAGDTYSGDEAAPLFPEDGGQPDGDADGTTEE